MGIHNLSSHDLYSKWKSMKQRCYYPKFRNFKYWGGRGIIVCNEWKNNFLAFYQWALNNGYEKGLEIDRIDNDGSYSPDNCRFVTHRENNLNNSLRETNKSGYKGISFDNQNKKWRASITVHYKNLNLGRYTTLKEAVVARNKFILDNDLQDEYPIQEWIKEA